MQRCAGVARHKEWPKQDDKTHTACSARAFYPLLLLLVVVCDQAATGEHHQRQAGPGHRLRGGEGEAKENRCEACVCVCASMQQSSRRVEALRTHPFCGTPSRRLAGGGAKASGWQAVSQQCVWCCLARTAGFSIHASVHMQARTCGGTAWDAPVSLPGAWRPRRTAWPASPTRAGRPAAALGALLTCLGLCSSTQRRRAEFVPAKRLGGATKMD